ncbi:MAG TPA: peptide ABC transporter substrate-binding protein [Ktedonobacterales bacterium]|nr:peptide ABC transporter substrate-binding protein [Ktedonobacterales bacterium]
MRSRKTIMFALVTMASVLVMVLTACGGSTSGTGAQAPDSKQVISVSLVPAANDIRRLDPQRITDLYSFSAAQPVFPGLYTYDNDYKIIPWAAQALPTVTDGGLTYTFKIRPGLKWSDGTPIDANTFAYSWNRGLDPCTNSGASSYLYPIKGAAAFNQGTCPDANATNPVSTDTLIGKSIVVTDPQTLTVTLEKPFAYFLPTVAATAVVLASPKQLIEKYGIKDWTEHLTDNGGFGGNLFKVTVWDHKGNLQLTRNDGFWGTKPKLRQINFKIYKDADTSYNSYLNGQVDVGVAGLPPTATYQQMKTRSDFHQSDNLATSYLGPNWAKPPFDDLAARQAFALAVDRDALNAVAQGAGTPTYHIVPKGQPGYFDGLKNIDGKTGAAANKADDAMAKQLITDYANRKCGGDITKCPKVTYETSNTPSNIAGSQALLQMWKTAMPGYPVEISNVDFGTLINDVYSGSAPQLFGIGWIVDYPDPQDWLSLQFLPGSSVNVQNINYAPANDLMNQADIEQDQTKRFQLYNQAEQMMVDQVGWIVTNQQIAVWLFSGSKIAGYRQNTSGYTSLTDWQNTVYVKG